MRSKQMVSVVFSVSSIAKQKMPLRCSWLPTWTKLGLWLRKSSQTGLSVSSNLVVGTHWLSAHNASPYTLVMAVSILSSQVRCHLISYVPAAELQVFLVFLILSLMLVLPTKKRLMPTAFSQVMSSFLNQKRFSQPIKKMWFLKLGTTVMVFSWFVNSWKTLKIKNSIIL